MAHRSPFRKFDFRLILAIRQIDPVRFYSKEEGNSIYLSFPSARLIVERADEHGDELRDENH